MFRAEIKSKLSVFLARLCFQFDVRISFISCCPMLSLKNMHKLALSIDEAFEVFDIDSSECFVNVIYWLSTCLILPLIFFYLRFPFNFRCDPKNHAVFHFPWNWVQLVEMLCPSDTHTPFDFASIGNSQEIVIFSKSSNIVNEQTILYRTRSLQKRQRIKAETHGRKRNLSSVKKALTASETILCSCWSPK